MVIRAVAPSIQAAGALSIDRLHPLHLTIMFRSVLFVLVLVGSFMSADAIRLNRLHKSPTMKAAVTSGSARWLNFPVAAASALKDEAAALARVAARVKRLLQKKERETPASVAIARLNELTRTTIEFTYVWESTPMPFIIDQDLEFEWGEAGLDEDEEDEIFF
jgi:hypothetical protein